jgi:hypothetical protein
MKLEDIWGMRRDSRRERKKSRQLRRYLMVGVP